MAVYRGMDIGTAKPAAADRAARAASFDRSRRSAGGIQRRAVCRRRTRGRCSTAHRKENAPVCRRHAPLSQIASAAASPARLRTGSFAGKSRTRRCVGSEKLHERLWQVDPARRGEAARERHAAHRPPHQGRPRHRAAAQPLADAVRRSRPHQRTESLRASMWPRGAAPANRPRMETNVQAQGGTRNAGTLGTLWRTSAAPTARRSAIAK